MVQLYLLHHDHWPVKYSYVFWSTVFILLPHIISMNLFSWKPFLFLRHFYLSGWFLPFDSWIFFHLLPNLLTCFWLFLVLSRMLSMLVAVNKRISCATRVKNNNLAIFTETYFNVFNKMNPILEHSFWVMNRKNVCWKTFFRSSKNSDEKEK